MTELLVIHEGEIEEEDGVDYLKVAGAQIQNFALIVSSVTRALNEKDPERVKVVLPPLARQFVQQLIMDGFPNIELES